MLADEMLADEMLADEMLADEMLADEMEKIGTISSDTFDEEGFEELVNENIHEVEEENFSSPVEVTEESNDAAIYHILPSLATHPVQNPMT